MSYNCYSLIMNNSNTNENNPNQKKLTTGQKARIAGAAIVATVSGVGLTASFNSNEAPVRDSNPATTEVPATTTVPAPTELIPPIAIQRNEDGTISDLPLGEVPAETPAQVNPGQIDENRFANPDGTEGSATSMVR
jgi:hypothetical protein